MLRERAKLAWRGVDRFMYDCVIEPLLRQSKIVAIAPAAMVRTFKLRNEVTPKRESPDCLYPKIAEVVNPDRNYATTIRTQ